MFYSDVIVLSKVAANLLMPAAALILFLSTIAPYFIAGLVVGVGVFLTTMQSNPIPVPVEDDTEMWLS